MKIQQRGFTLVELSIVLVILGLLVGGVLTGQSLIRAAELRSVSNQFQRQQAAIHTFRDKYFAIPGDMTNAISYWGAADADPATCKTTVSTDSKTCNGNGDGEVGSMLSGTLYYESPRFWQHLANAGLIEGNYSGVAGANAVTATPANAPSGKISGSLWTAVTYGRLVGVSTAFDGDYGNSLTIGGIRPNNTAAAPLFKPEEIYNIDMKMDDGKPGTGKVVVGASSANACTTVSSFSDLTASYLLSSPTIACIILFRNVY